MTFEAMVEKAARLYAHTMSMPVEVVRTVLWAAGVPDLLAENARLQALIRRALAELDAPAYYGPGSVWDAMLAAVSEEGSDGPQT